MNAVLVQARLREPIERGEVTLLFRRWRRCQAVAGHHYRTAAGRLAVDAVDEVAGSAITDGDARQAGYSDAAALVADLRGSADLPIYRLAVRALAGPDPRDVLAGKSTLTAQERRDLDQRLARLDRLSSHGPWTAATLRLIAERPGERAPDLAVELGRETLPFKTDVRKLKSLGLTLSLPVGYRLSPRGEAYRGR